MRGNKLVIVELATATSKLTEVDETPSSLDDKHACWGHNSTHYTEDSNVDCRHDNSSSPFQLSYESLCLAYDGYPVDDNLHQNLHLENPTKQDEEQHSNAVDGVSAGGCLVLTLCRRAHPYVGSRIPWNSKFAKIRMATLAAISTQIMYTYELLRGFLLRLVCLTASHTVSRPKPSTKPTASDARVWSLFSAAVAMCALVASLDSLVPVVDGKFTSQCPWGDCRNAGYGFSLNISEWALAVSWQAWPPSWRSTQVWQQILMPLRPFF